MKKLSACFSGLVFLTLGNLLYAQGQSAEEFANTYFNVLKTQGFTAIGDLVHPEALEEFKGLLIPVFEFGEEIDDNELMQISFGPTATVADIKNMSSQAFFNGFMNIMAVEMGSATVSFDKLEVLGTVPEGLDRHVLTRITVGAGEFSLTEFEVISLKPYNGEWRVQLNGEFRGMAEALRNSIPL